MNFEYIIDAVYTTMIQDGKFFITTLIISVLAIIIGTIRQLVWDNTSHKVEATILDVKLYKDGLKEATSMTGNILRTHYPLSIVKLSHEESVKERYLLVNAKDNIDSKTKKAQVFADITGNVLTYDKTPKYTHLALIVNILGYYITAAIEYLLTWLIAIKLLNSQLAYEIMLIITLMMFMMVTTRYIIRDFLLFNLKLRIKYEYLVKEQGDKK